jgi:hypothetical protein
MVTEGAPSCEASAQFPERRLGRHPRVAAKSAWYCALCDMDQNGLGTCVQTTTMSPKGTTHRTRTLRHLRDTAAAAARNTADATRQKKGLAAVSGSLVGVVSAPTAGRVSASMSSATAYRPATNTPRSHSPALSFTIVTVRSARPVHRSSHRQVPNPQRPCWSESR